ncbi:MAG: hypothetical protein O9331_03145 [Acidovorax sp.]|nr:hypothetical protein [Acidovorax sp.]
MARNKLIWFGFFILGVIALVWVVAKSASQKTLWIESIDVGAIAPSKACIQLALKNVGGGSLEETGIDGIFETPIAQEMREFSVQSSMVKDKGIIRISVSAKQGKIDDERKIFLQSRLKVFAQAMKDECSK